VVLYDDKIIIKCNYVEKGCNEYLDLSISEMTAEMPAVSLGTPINEMEKVSIEIKA